MKGAVNSMEVCIENVDADIFSPDFNSIFLSDITYCTGYELKESLTVDYALVLLQIISSECKRLEVHHGLALSCNNTLTFPLKP